MRFFIIMLALALAGCGASADGTELGGVAQWTGTSPGPAIAAAQTHCQKYGRTARVQQVQQPVGYVTFSCEKP